MQSRDPVDAAQTMVFIDRIEVLSVLAASGNVPEACLERPRSVPGASGAPWSVLRPRRIRYRIAAVAGSCGGRQLQAVAVAGRLRGRQDPTPERSGPGFRNIYIDI